MAGTRGGKQPRHDEWTPERRARFLAALSASCNVQAAARATGKSVMGAYQVRRREPQFAAQWAEALQEGYDRLERELLAFALSGGVTAEEDGTIPPPPFDPELALRVLSGRSARDKLSAGRPPRREPTKAELIESLQKRLALLAKRKARR